MIGEVLLIGLGILLLIVSLVGAFLPVIPSPLTGWLGLFLLYFVEMAALEKSILWISLVITLLVTVLDYIIPATGVKKMGGTQYGMWGAIFGTLAGLLFPIGIIIGTFLGALVGELLYDNTNQKRALRAALGALLGFLLSSGLKFLVSVGLVYYFFKSLFAF